MTDAMSRFIAAESARLRSHGISEARIAWLLGTKPANANESRQAGRPAGVRNGDVREAVLEALGHYGAMTYDELAAAIGRKRPNVTTWVKQNEKRGIVRRAYRQDGRTIIEDARW